MRFRERGRRGAQQIGRCRRDDNRCKRGDRDRQPEAGPQRPPYRHADRQPVQYHGTRQVVALHRQQRNAVDNCVNDQPQRRDDQHQHMGLVQGAVESAFDDNRESDAEYEEHGGQGSADLQGLGNDIDADDPGDRDEDEAVEHLSGDTMPAAQPVNDGAQQQGSNAENQVHKLWLRYAGSCGRRTVARIHD